MQRLALPIIAAILPIGVFAVLPAGMALAQSAQGDRPVQILSREEVSPPLPQDGDATDDGVFSLASVGAQAPVTLSYDRHLSIHPDLTATDVQTQRLKILAPDLLHRWCVLSSSRNMAS